MKVCGGEGRARGRQDAPCMLAITTLDPGMARWYVIYIAFQKQHPSAQSRCMLVSPKIYFANIFPPCPAELTTPPPPSRAKVFLSENRKAMKAGAKK